MSTDFAAMIARLPLERNGELSLYRQLRAAIEMAIIDGALPDGAALPSVRRLAASLNIAPVTVVQAYRDLQAAQLIRSVPKRGYFVSISPTMETPAADLVRVQSLIDEALNAATEVGLTSGQFLRLASDRVKRRNTGPRVVAVVGQRDAALSERVAVVARAVADLGVQAVGISFEDLEAGDASARPVDLDAIECFLGSVGEIQRAARLVGKGASRILPMTRVLRDDVRDFIHGQPETARFGIIAGSPELIERILAVVRRLHPLREPPAVAAISEPDDVARVIAAADVIVIGSLAYPRLTPYLPLLQPHVEFVSIPDERTLGQLRARLIEGEVSEGTAASGVARR